MLAGPARLDVQCQHEAREGKGGHRLTGQTVNIIM